MTVDREKPAVSRVYAGLLGDASTFGADREMAADLLAVAPEARFWAQTGRAFLRRAVSSVVAAGVRQVLDIGCGLPATPGSVNEAAWRIAPDVRVAYVDVDPVVVASTRQLFARDDRVVTVLGDLRDPVAVLRDTQAAGLLDWEQPVAVVLGAVLHFVADADDPAGIVCRLRKAVVPGSYLIVSHASVPAVMTPELVRVTRAYCERTAPLTLRSRQQVADLLEVWGGLVEPGVCVPAFWRPDPGDLDGPDVVERASRVPGWVGVAVRGRL
jgi:SAM-dependent methyltransferase